ncbi:MAG: hypothetical protein WC692_08655 [Erythrobacter sp.]|jgi:hypothetical protein
MLANTRGAIRALATLLLITVATQIFYITVVMAAGDETPLRPATWLLEELVFLGIVILGFDLAVRQADKAWLWLAVAISGLFNAVQVGMGLSMFAPAEKGSDSDPQLFATVLAGAFFFYFVAKLLLGAVAVVLGFGGFSTQAGLVRRALAGLMVLSGLAAVGIDLLAILDSKSWLFPAGAAGTVATAFLALGLLAAKAE